VAVCLYVGPQWGILKRFGADVALWGAWLLVLSTIQGECRYAGVNQSGFGTLFKVISLPLLGTRTIFKYAASEMA